MVRYDLRYFFDAGSGVCLWAGNEQALERFGYAIEAASLGLPDALVAEADRLLTTFDASYDWNDPAGPSPQSESTRLQFVEDAGRFLDSLRNCLGPDYLVIDKVKKD
jgi:hypothetical protein